MHLWHCWSIWSLAMQTTIKKTEKRPALGWVSLMWSDTVTTHSIISSICDYIENVPQIKRNVNLSICCISDSNCHSVKEFKVIVKVMMEISWQLWKLWTLFPIHAKCFHIVKQQNHVFHHAFPPTQWLVHPMLLHHIHLQYVWSYINACIYSVFFYSCFIHFTVFSFNCTCKDDTYMDLYPCCDYKVSLELW